MGFLDSVKEVNEKLAERGNDGDWVKTVWANLQSDGDSAKVIPLQELDVDSPAYNEKLGKALFALEHTNPDNFKKSALCTADEGGCYGCDQGWYQKVVLYVNVLFDNGKDKPFVAVLNKGTGKGSVGKELLSIAADDDFDNSISDKVFKFTRSGKGKDTSYSFSPIKKHGKDLDEYADQLFDLKEVPFKVAPEKQEAYYEDNKAKPDESPKGDAASPDNDW